MSKNSVPGSILLYKLFQQIVSLFYTKIYFLVLYFEVWLEELTLVFVTRALMVMNFIAKYLEEEEAPEGKLP